MTPTTRNICTHAVFATFSLNLASQPILFHTVVTEEEFFKKRRAELFDCGVANDMSKVAHLLVCIMSTPCFCFARFNREFGGGARGSFPEQRLVIEPKLI